MILAPAASGKSVMRYARMLGEAYDQELSQSYTARQKAYQKALKAFEEGSCGAEPQKPRRELFYIPANSSSCRVIRHLQECSGSGIICETEADTLGNVLKQDWGGYSDILRKAYSGEPISLSRQSGDEFLSIAGVKLSVLMTGTPNQVFRLIPGAEDGLFSRFLFYAYSQPPRWEDVSPRGQALDLDDHFREGARELLNRIHYWKGKQISFQLTKVQWERINDRFSILLPRAVAISCKEAAATVKRYGNALFRIAMILTVCRTYEQGKTEKELECRDADFEIALNLVEVYLQHALFIVERLPKERTPSVNQLPYHKRQFFEALPKKFKRKEAVALGLSFEMKPRTVDRLLKDLVNVSLKEDGYGCYEKQ